MDIKTAECLAQLVTLLDDANIHNCPLEDEQFLVRFVRSKNLNAAAAFKTLKNYLKLRSKIPIFYPSATKEGLNCGMVTALKHRDPEGRQIFLFRTALWDTCKVSLDQAFLACTLILEEMTNTIETQEKGLILIQDHKGLNLSHFTQMGLKQIQRIIGLQGGSPAKIRGIHIVNQPRIFGVLYSIGYPFLSEKLKKRIHIHGNDLNSLHNFLPPSILPESLGGDLEEDDARDLQLLTELFKRDEYYKNSMRIICRNSS